MAITVLYLAVCVACWGYAIRYGGKAARVAFVCFIAMTVGTMLSTSGSQEFRTDLSIWSGFNPLLFATDLFYFVALFWIAGKSHRYWPIWSAGFALLCVLTHFGPLIDPGSDSKIYRGLETFWQLPILVTMVIGIAKDKAGGIGTVRADTDAEEPRRARPSRFGQSAKVEFPNVASASIDDRR